MNDYSENVNTKFVGTDNVSPAIHKIGQSVDALNAGFEKLNKLGSLVGLTAGIGSIAAIGTATVSAVHHAISEAQEYEAQEMKLITIMKERMGANTEMIESVHQVIEAQEQLGVVDASVQIAGAQQMATFVHSADALNSLIPVINDLTVQQHGYNATAQNSVEIANMMGKVFSGQVGALQRVGISLSDDEKELLKTLPEQERAALLAKVITENVGKMNEALSKTPEGRKVQALNKLEGEWRKLGTVLGGVKDQIETELASSQTTALVAIGSGITIAFAVISGAVIKTIEAIEWLGRAVMTLAGNFAPLIAIIGILYGLWRGMILVMGIYRAGLGMTTAGIWAYCVASNTAAVFTKAQAGAMTILRGVLVLLRTGSIMAAAATWGLNIAMLAIPLAAIAIIGVVVALVAHFSRAAEAMGGLREVAAEAWESIVNTIGWAVNEVIDFINLFIGAMNKAASLSNKLFHTGFSPLETINHVDVSGIAYGGGDFIRTGDLSSIFGAGDEAINTAMQAPATMPDLSNIGDATGNIKNHVGKIAKATQRIADKIDMTDEEIRNLRNAAQKTVLSNYMNQPVTITIINHNNIDSKTDIDGMMSDFVKGVRSAAASMRKGTITGGVMT